MSAFNRKYGTSAHIYLPIPKRGVVDFALGADWTPAAGDVKVSIDGGAAADITTLPTAIAMGNTAYWDFALSASETTGKKIVVTVGDAATKAVEDQFFTIETYGNASAEYPDDVSAAAPDVYGRLGAPAGASVSADIAAVNAKTTNLPASPAAVGSNMGTVTSVTGNVGGNVVGSVGSVTGAVGSVTGNVGGNVVGSVASVTATVNADIKKINGTTVNGDGSGTPWGP